MTDEEKFARLRAADVFCAPSLHGESFGVVLIEAMAAGTTVVASALDGYRNVATDGVDALLVEPGDAEALAGAFRRVTTDTALAARLRRSGDERAEGFAMTSLDRPVRGDLPVDLPIAPVDEGCPRRLATMIPLIIVMVVVVVLVIYLIVAYNGLIRRRTRSRTPGRRSTSSSSAGST